jgi:hypothetical protein
VSVDAAKAGAVEATATTGMVHAAPRTIVRRLYWDMLEPPRL